MSAMNNVVLAGQLEVGKHVAPSMGNQQDGPREGETLQGPIKSVGGAVLPKDHSLPCVPS